MELVFLRVQGRSGPDGEVVTYPLSALDCLKHNSRHHVYAIVGGSGWPLAECRSEEEACTLEEALLHEIAATIQEHRRLADPQIPACIIDLNQVAAGNLAEIWTEAQLEADHAGDFEGSILVLRRGRGLDAVPRPDYCPHKDWCPGSDCCEEGERCVKAAGRGRS